MKRDVFPSTLNTWIDRRLDEGDGGRAEVNRHVMSVYAMPLRTYFLGTGDRWLGEADEVVQGFFADRLDRPRFFADWQQADMPLRRWLINAFCFYLKELRRRRWRDDRSGTLPDDPVVYEGNAERDFDRAFVASVVQRAMELARESCEADGLGEHWEVFTDHFCHDRAYAELGPEHGVDAARAAVMARTASRRFRTAVREVLARDGGDERLDEQIRALVENVQ